MPFVKFLVPLFLADTDKIVATAPLNLNCFAADLVDEMLFAGLDEAVKSGENAEQECIICGVC